MKLHQMTMLTSEAPAQFEARTSDDRPAYVRFRSGWLSVEVGLPGDSGNGLPGDGYVVFEEFVSLPYGRENAIAWAEVQAQIASVDLQERIEQFETTERAFRARWNEAFQHIQPRVLPNVVLWTLRLAEVLWVTPHQNRVGRHDFEWALREHCLSGICAYVFADATRDASTITVLHTDETVGRWDAMDLALAGVRAFGGVRYGPSGGSGRGEADGIRIGDADEAFTYVAECLAQTEKELPKTEPDRVPPT